MSSRLDQIWDKAHLKSRIKDRSTFYADIENCTLKMSVLGIELESSISRETLCDIRHMYPDQIIVGDYHYRIINDLLDKFLRNQKFVDRFISIENREMNLKSLDI